MDERMKSRKSTYNLTIFAISKFISTVGGNILSFGIALYVLRLTGSATSFSIVLISGILPRVLLAPYVGYLADNYSKKFFVIAAQIMQIIIFSTLLIYSEINGLSIIAIYITIMLSSVFGAFNSIPLTASIASLVKEDHIQKAMSFNQMSVSIAAIGAPIIGGLLYGTVSIEMFFIIQIIAYAISLSLDATMNFKLYSVIVVSEAKEKIIDSMKSAYHYITKKDTLKTTMLLSTCLNFFFAGIAVGSSFILVQVIQFQALHIGWIEAFREVGMLGASIFLAVKAKVENPISFSEKSILTLSMTLILLVVPIMLPFNSYGATLVYYMFVFAFLESMALGSLLYGFLYDFINVEVVVICSAIIILIITLVLLRPAAVKRIMSENKIVQS